MIRLHRKWQKQGIQFAKAMGAEVILLHVISDPVYYSSPEYSPIMGFTGYLEMGPMKLGSIEGLKKASENYLLQISQHLKDETIKIQVKEGDFADSILKTAKDLHADADCYGLSWQEMVRKNIDG